MSGGSYNYLCTKDSSNVNVSDLAKMRDRLFELGFRDLGNETNEIIERLDQINNLCYNLHGVWRAVEWMDSGDVGIEEVVKQSELYNK